MSIVETVVERVEELVEDVVEFFAGEKEEAAAELVSGDGETSDPAPVESAPATESVEVPATTAEVTPAADAGNTKAA